MRRVLVVASVVLACAGIADAQPRIAVTRWTVDDGLPQTSVTSIARDARGFLWISTFGGLVRFDGREFVRVEVPGTDRDGDRFTSLATLGDELWIGSERGRLFHLDVTGRHRPAEVPIDLGGEAAIVQLLPVDGRLVLAAGGLGAWEVSGGQVRPVDPRPVDTAVVVRAQDGTLWAAGQDQVRCLAPGCVPIAVPRPRALSAQGGVVRVLTAGGRFIVRDGQLVADAGPPWLTAAELAGQGWQLAQISGPPVELEAGAAPLTQIRSALADEDGVLWLGSNHEGLLRVRDRGASAIALPAPQGRAAALALPLPDGTVLAAGYCAGLYRVTPGAGAAPPARVDGPPACVTALANDPSGGAWIGAADHGGAELWRGDGGTATRVPIDGALTGDPKAIIDRGDGALWVGTTDGLWRLVRGGDRVRVERRWQVADGLPHSIVYAITVETSDALLIGTAAGAVRLRGDHLAPLITAGDRRATVRDIVVRDGVAWLATYGDGVARVALTGPSAGEARWRGLAQGFCSDHLSRIVDVGGAAWINANQGVLVVPWDALDAHVAGVGHAACDRHATGEGNGGGSMAGGVLPDGRLVFPGEHGVAVLEPVMPRRRTVPGAFVQLATVDGLPLALDGRTTVPPGRRDLMVKLETPLFDLGAGEAPRFRVVVSRDGREVAREQTGLDVNFLGLAPGSYVLRIQRLDAHGSGPVMVVRFRLARAWWETSAARIGLPLLAMLIAAVLLWLWVRSLRARARALEAELEERARGEAARRERDAIYTTVFERSPGPLFLLTRAGEVRQLNAAARRLLGAAEGTAAVDLAAAMADDRARWSALLSAAVRAPTSDELTVRTVSGDRRRVQLHAGAVDREGEPFTLLAAVDVTAEREAEERRTALRNQAADRERLEAIGRLAGGVAHDFNNVLAVFQVLVDEARGHVANPSRMQTTLADLQVAVRAGRDVATRFLGFGKDVGAPAAIALDDVVPANRRLLEKLLGPGARLTLDCRASGKRVKVVAGHIDRLLLNLVVNASDALGGQPGDITIRTRVVDAATAAGTVVLPAPAGSLVELTVEDTGCGMDEATRRRAFEPFFSTKDAKGTGLGLSVVYNLVSAAGGGLAVDSSPGQGSRFVIQLPLMAGEAPPSSGPSLTPVRRVMVVEDNDLVRTSMVRVFRAQGWTVLEAEDGVAALERLGDGVLDLLVTDQHMPRLDGAGLITALRARGWARPVIVVSGDPVDASARLGPRSDAVRVMGKPFAIDELIALADELGAAT